MSVEIEAKFLDVDRDDLRRRLAAEKFELIQPDYLMRRAVFDLPPNVHNLGGYTWARVRDEAGRITVSYKRTVDDNKIDGTEEVEITANDFDEACRLLDAFGLARKAYQETRRENWRRGDVEVMIDEWLALKPFVEIEAPDAQTVAAAAAALGFDWSQAVFGPVGPLYERIGIPAAVINRHALLTFETIEETLALRVR